MRMGIANQANPKRQRLGITTAVASHFWFKFLGTTGFIAVFFMAYLYLLKHPAFAVTVIPETGLDRLIGVQPLALPLYLSLWLYLSLPVMLMTARRSIVEYGVWAGALCLVALTIFYFWPTAIPPSHLDWTRYPGLSFLKGMDAAGNACPSLHVATAVFAGFWLDRQLGSYDYGRWIRLMNVLWCTGIVYSTMATKQHMAIDVAAGIGLALAFAWTYSWSAQRRGRRIGAQRWIGQPAVERE